MSPPILIYVMRLGQIRTSSESVFLVTFFAAHLQACSSKKMADAAQRELETERNTCGGLRRVREDLLVTAAEDKKTISRQGLAPSNALATVEVAEVI